MAVPDVTEKSEIYETLWHKHWSRWIVTTGSAKHADMQRVLRTI